jgi:hypothetical protein
MWASVPQALVSLKKCMLPPLPFFKVNIYPFPLPHFASIFFAYLWSFRWPNYIGTLPRYFSFRLPHLNISTGPPSDELDKNIQRTWLSENLSHWNRCNHFRSGLNWFRKFKKRCFKNQMSVIWSWTYFYNLHWNNYLYFKRLTLHLRWSCGIVTHGRSREFRMHMKNPAQTGSDCIRFNDLNFH